ncbi:MAG: cysteine--tRNA ligase, partial [Alphaproteobacteria bacterium]|nr:cysteine--tRNA ligase [Alphaproteobacteria bacterium]
LSHSSDEWFKNRNNSKSLNSTDLKITEEEINSLILERYNAKNSKNFKKADEIRENLLKFNIILEDQPGKTIWRKI